MKVICVSNRSVIENLGFMVGKWYDAYENGMSDLILVKGDNDTWSYMDREYFRTVEELREEKLKEIGI